MSNANELLARILAAKMGKPDKIPAGFRTAVEWADLWNRERGCALRACKAGVESGLMECQTFRIICGDRPKRVQHFRETK